jgi:hypothetical protein
VKRWAALLAGASLLGACRHAVLPERSASPPTRSLRLALILSEPSRGEDLAESLRGCFKSVILIESLTQAHATHADLFGRLDVDQGRLTLIGPALEPIDAFRFKGRDRLADALLASPGLSAYAASVQQRAKTAPRPAAPDKASAPGAGVPAYKLEERPDDYSLVVGIEEYRSAPPAPSAQKDAEAVRAHLAALGYPERNIVVLTGESATRAAVAEAVEGWLPKNVRGKSRVLVYFAGNGVPGYLLSWDGSPEFPATTSYPLQRLYEKLDGLRAREVLLVLDACMPAMDPPPGKLAVLAARPCDERSGELTRRLLGALNQSRGAVGFRDLSRRLKGL